MPHQITKDLEVSPMFNLSLSSKELFHSNFLAWLGNNIGTRGFFVEVINELVAGLNLRSSENWTVEREDNHFDLCIKEKDKKTGKYFLIIENKVKSIPIKKQLDGYVAESVNGKDQNTKYLLLTLTEKFAHRTKIDKHYNPSNDWIVKTYSDLAVIMLNKKGLLSDPYILSLLKDYIEFIENLDALVKDWQSELYFAEDWNDIPRLKDLHAKIQFSRYCEKLKKEKLSKLNNIEIYDDNVIPKSKNSSKVYVKVCWGYASKGQDGILDIEIPVTSFNNPQLVKGIDIDKKTGLSKSLYTIKIQVQGRNYRHVLETNTSFTKSPVNKALIEIGRNSPYTDPSQLNFFSKDPLDSNLPIPDYGNNLIFDNKPRSLYPVNMGNARNQIPASRWPFASYKDKGKVQFIYQSRNIKKQIPIDDVLDNIVEEVKRLLYYFSKVSMP